MIPYISSTGYPPTTQGIMGHVQVANLFWPSRLNLNNLKLNKKYEAKTIFIQEKLMLRLTFNPGLALTGFRTTRPRTLDAFEPGMCNR